MPSSIRIRPAHAHDMDILGALKLESTLAWGRHVEELQALPEARQVPQQHLPFVLVAELEGEIVGFATVLPADDDRQAEIEDLFIAPAMWRKGIATQLLAEAERRAVANGVRSLHVVGAEKARHFYEASGFRVVGTVMTEFEPAPTMRKDLLSAR